MSSIQTLAVWPPFEESEVDPVFVQSAMPESSVNGDLYVNRLSLDDGANTLWIRRVIPTGLQGISRDTRIDFEACQLFGGHLSQVSLIVQFLPFHGVGATLQDAQRDLVAAIEEVQDELEEDVREGRTLSLHLQAALAFARQIFGSNGD